MEREFDRELDDDGWGPANGPWKPLQEQIDHTLKAGGAVTVQKDKGKKITEM